MAKRVITKKLGRPKGSKDKLSHRKRRYPKRPKKPKEPKAGRDVKGRLLKGTVINPHGRPALPEVQLLREAVEAVGKRKKKSFYKLVAEKAYEDNSVLIALLRKFTPDLKAIESVVTTFEASMSDELAKAIQDELRGRFS